jgi:thioredoxin-related protein
MFGMLRAALAALAFFALPAMTALAQQRLELIYVERSGCPWCHRFEQESLGPYQASEFGRDAPLRRFSLDNGQPKLAGLSEPVRFTPTFILLRDGRETARIVGYRDNATFFGLIERHVADQRTKQGG